LKGVRERSVSLSRSLKIWDWSSSHGDYLKSKEAKVASLSLVKSEACLKKPDEISLIDAF
jgi:hypothetical protein